MTTGLRVEQVRGLDRRRRDEVFSDEFGVRADGTDQTAALTRALQAAATAGKTLVIPPGTYNVRQVLLPANTRMRGFGPGSVLRRVGGGGGTVLSITGSNVHIADLKVDGNVAGGGTTGTGAIDSSGNSDVTIEGCEIIDAVAAGIRCTNGSRLTFRNNRILRPTHFGIRVQCTVGSDQSDVVATGNYIDRSSLPADTASLHGMLIRGSDDAVTRILRRVVVADNIVRQPLLSTLGICIEVWAYEASITGNVCHGGFMGISTANGKTVSIAGNTCAENESIGIEVISALGGFGKANRATCTGNTVDGAGVCSTGIALSGAEGNDEISVVGNTVTDTIIGGIHILGTPRTVISSNYVRWDSTLHTTTNYGIRFQSIGRNWTADGRAVCTNNYVDGGSADADSRGIHIAQVVATGDPAASVVVGNNLITQVRDGITFSVNGAVNFVGTCVGNHIEASVTNHIVDTLVGGGTTVGIVRANNT